VTVAFSGGCTATATTAVQVNPLPNPTINSNSPICIGQDINFIGGGVGTYSWTGPSGFNNTAQSPTITSASPSNSGLYTLTITDANSCVNFTTALVTVNAQPNVSATGTTVCENANAPLSSSGGVSYSWSGPGGYTSSAQNPVVTGATFASAGQYTVLVTDANTCTNTAVASLVVTPGVSPTISSNSPVCVNEILIFNAGGGVSYNWSGPNGFVTTASSPSIIASSTAQNGTYFVTVTDANGCFATTSINATVNPLPVTSISAGNNRGCPILCVTFTAQSNPAIANANWTFGNGTFATGTNPAEACFTTPGIYTITTTITDINGCPGAATYTAEVYPQPVADFNHAPIKPIINVDADVHFTDASHSASITAWNWYFMNTPQYQSTVPNPTFIYQDPGDYVVALVVKSDQGCTDTLLKKITVGEDFGLYVPNAFTPNNDGLNDIFQPKGFGVVKYNLQIFDRWGEKIFESDEFEKGWDGIYQGRGGKVCPEDTYTWKIKATSVFSKAHEFTGHVTLIK
jgi:gliding motility-associated-like protein